MDEALYSNIGYTSSDGDYLICPYCGNKKPANSETFFSSSAECDEEMECEKCGRIYDASREVEFHYSTSKRLIDVYNERHRN